MDTMHSPMSSASNRSMKKALSVVIIIALLALILIIEMRRREAQDQLEQLTVRLEQLQTGNTQQNREAANRIIERVRAHMSIPDDVEPTVATIIDVETLRQRNPFYNKAENGDHLVVTSERAILYDPDEDKIIDVVPVQLQPADAAAQGDAPAPEGNVAPQGDAAPAQQ